MTTLPIDTLLCDTTKIAVWQSAPSYAYNKELMSQDINIYQWLMGKFQKLLSHLFGPHTAEYSGYIILGIAILLIALVVWYLYKRRPELFMRNKKNKPLDYDIIEDTIYGVDFENGIRCAVSGGNYKEATRLIYLQTLKYLSDKGLIDWQTYKTPTQYLYELKTPAFRELTNHFLRVRYGNFKASSDLFERMQSLQTEIEKGGNA